MKRKILKQAQTYGLYFGRKLKSIALLLLISALLVSCSNKEITPPKETNIKEVFVSTEHSIGSNQGPVLIPPARYNLPSQQEAKAKLTQLYQNVEDYVFTSNSGNFYRLLYPKGDYIYINICFNTNEMQREILELSIAEFNNVFSMINPNYKYKLNFSPTKQDTLSPYSIEVYETDSLPSDSEDQVVGRAEFSFYRTGSNNLFDYGITANTITLIKEVTQNPEDLMDVFKHELLHMHGAKDAYKIENGIRDTIMQNLGNSTTDKCLSIRDVSMLDALYRDPNNVLTPEEIESFIKNYSEKNPYTFSQYTKSKTIESLLSGLNIKKIKENIQKSSNIPTEIKEDIIKNLDLNKRNMDFGKESFNIIQNYTTDNNHEYFSYSYGDNNLEYIKKNKDSAFGWCTTFEKETLNGVLVITSHDKVSILININDYVLSFDSAKTGLSNPKIYKLTDKTPQQFVDSFQQKTADREKTLDR
ncbi:MAG: hypothetical protein E7375_04225 [Clostridiales bacterium]|nr:hypothetical protein [Clostridiales bacterium]